MIRYRMVTTAVYGKAREVIDLLMEIDALCEQRGWARWSALAPVAGSNNEFVVETQYPDLAAFEAENRAQLTDPDFMKLFRGMSEYIYPQSSRTELLESVYQIA